MSGELNPNSHQNIKMTLYPARFPTNFEGEIQCSIDWENENDVNKHDLKSVHTTTAVIDSAEYLFLRLKKRSKFVSYPSLLLNAIQTKMEIGVENKEGESLVENIVMETVHDILESDEIDKLFDEC